MNNKIIICYIATVGTLLGFAISLLSNWILVAVAFMIAFVICLVWFAGIIQKRDEKEYASRRFYSKKFNDIEQDFKRLEEELAKKADKPKSNIRTGSRPSEQYYAMIGRKGVESNDSRAEDTTAS